MINPPLNGEFLNSGTWASSSDGDTFYSFNDESSKYYDFDEQGVWADSNGYNGWWFNVSENITYQGKDYISTSAIVIDAREHAVDPSMSPEVIDMQGNLVYGTISYSRSKAVNRGPVGYAYSMDDRNVSQRVGSNPLFVEAVGSLDDDVYITSMDAAKVREAEKSFGVLSNCRVMLLLQ